MEAWHVGAIVGLCFFVVVARFAIWRTNRRVERLMRNIRNSSGNEVKE